MLVWMVGTDEIAEAEGDAEAWMRAAGFHPEAPPSIAQMIERLLRRPVRYDPTLDGEASLEPVGGSPDDGYEVIVNPLASPARQRIKGAHELGHWILMQRGYVGPHEEELADAVGAALIAPRSAFKASLRHLGHRVHELARRFKTTQSLALLRVGEVTGRPVLLMRPKGPIARGESFVWPKTSSVVRMLREGGSVVHPLKITDEPDRMGFMLRRESTWP